MSTTDDVKERFEWDARNFDSIYRSGSRLGGWANRVFRRAIFERFRITFERAGDLRGRSVLDVGCGSGIYCAEFAKRGARRVVGLDFSDSMLELARAEVQREGVSEKCQFVVGDFMRLELGEKFDVTIAMGVFDYLSNPQPFLQKMAVVTSKTVLASFPAPSGVRGMVRRLRYRLTGRGDVYFYSEARVRELATAAGFSRYEIVPIIGPYSGSGFVLVGSN